MTAKEAGVFGETKACEFLEKNGVAVLKRNFHCRMGEIDIIAKDGGTIVFVEVKTRASKAYGTPAEFVDFKKQEKITKTALYYLGRDDADMRFDVIEVMYRVCGDVFCVTEINHIKSAF
ncbi:MAG: YraN family protein [Clostridia bacterium]|nr:YraN family protein [Clostridia bacterium]